MKIIKIDFKQITSESSLDTPIDASISPMMDREPVTHCFEQNTIPIVSVRRANVRGMQTFLNGTELNYTSDVQMVATGLMGVNGEPILL